MSDWYVTHSGAGAADGTSLADAWAVANIVWGIGGVVAGDTLHLNGTLYSTLTVGADGSAGNPIVIDFGETGLIYPVTHDVSSGWTEHSTGIYKRTLGAGNSQVLLLWEDGALAPVMDPTGNGLTESAVAAAIGSGEWTIRGTSGSWNQLWYRPTSGDLANHVVDYSWRTTNDGAEGALNCVRDYITLRNVRIKGARWVTGDPRSAVLAGDGLTVDGWEDWNCSAGARLMGGAGVKIFNVHTHDNINSGWMFEGSDSDLDQPLIRGYRSERNQFFYMNSSLVNGYHGDGDGLGIGGLGGNVISPVFEDLVFKTLGAYGAPSASSNGIGVTINTTSVCSVTSPTFRRVECDSLAVRAFRFGEDTANFTLSGTITIEALACVDVGDNETLASATIQLDLNGSNRTIVINGVTNVGCGANQDILLSDGENENTYNFRNMAFVGTDVVMTGGTWRGDLFFTSTDGSPSVDIDYNAYGSRAGLSGADIVRNLATGYATVSAWNAASGQDGNSIEGELLVTLSGRPEGNSPLIGAGNNSPSVGADGLRFMAPPSMGAYEVRSNSGYARNAGAMPARVLPAGVDIAKARAA